MWPEHQGANYSSSGKVWGHTPPVSRSPQSSVIPQQFLASSLSIKEPLKISLSANLLPFVPQPATCPHIPSGSSAPPLLTPRPFPNASSFLRLP